MKPSYLSLLIAAGAFAASTVYLGRQLAEEHTRMDQVLAESQALQARVMELEQLRATLAAPQTHAGQQMADAAELLSASGAVLVPGARTGVEAGAPTSTTVRRTKGPRPEQSEAFLRMMRGQMRAQNRQIYADLGTQLGLTRDDTNKLIDLLTDQQVDLMSGRMRNPEAGPSDVAAWQQKQLDDVSALIGYDKVERFQAYQESLPARQEVATIARQLEGADLQLDESQREKLVAALTEERKRIPVPEYADGTSPEVFSQAMSAWQDDYQRRTDARVRAILNSEQQGPYDDYQQWSREMRAQFESHRVIRGKDGSGANVMMAEPAGVAVPAAPAP